MEYIYELLDDLYSEMSHKEMFLPLIIANSIVCYQLCHYDKNYWQEFCHAAKNPNININSIDTMYNFMDIFLQENLQFQYSHTGRMQELKRFRSFFKEFFFKQKYYFKNIDMLDKSMTLALGSERNGALLKFTHDILSIGGRIRFISSK